MHIKACALWLLSILCLAVSSGCGKGEGKNADKKVTDKGGKDGVAKWESDPARADSLDTPVDFEGYTVRPPKDYTRTDPAGAPPGAKMVAWAGKRRPDGGAAAFLLMVGTPPKGERIPPLEEALNEMLQGSRRSLKDWSQTPTEFGEVNGLSFARTRWSGTHVVKGAKMHGFTYVAFDGPRFIQMGAQDVAPHEETLKVGEAAALTLQRR